MRRSCLFIPSSNPGMIQSSEIYENDTVIFDLEDGVSLNEKDSARILLKNFLDSFDLPNKEVMVRINSFDLVNNVSLGEIDLNEIVSDKIDSIMFPKARVSELEKLDSILTKIEEDKKLSKKIRVVPIIELAISLIEVEQIARCNRVDGILLGAEDLTSDMEVARSKSSIEIAYPRSRIAIACKAYKIDAIDTPYTNVNNYEGLKEDALYAKSIGMNAKACIHPNQIEIINKVFSPNEKEILKAQRIIAAFKEEKKGAFSLDGKMVDKPIIERSMKILEKAKKFGLIDEE